MAAYIYTYGWSAFLYSKNLEKEMATHSSILDWKIPWTEEPGGYSPRSCKESDTTEHKAQQKSTQHCKVIILQLKVLKNILKRRKHPSALSHPVWQTLWVDVADAVWAHPYPFILLLSSSCQTPHASAYFQCPRLFASSQADGSVWDSNSPCIPQPGPTGRVITPTGTCYSGS